MVNVDGQNIPLFVADPSSSGLSLLTWEDFQGESIQSLQEHAPYHTYIVPNYPIGRSKPWSSILENIGGANKTVELQGLCHAICFADSDCHIDQSRLDNKYTGANEGLKTLITVNFDLVRRNGQLPADSQHIWNLLDGPSTPYNPQPQEALASDAFVIQSGDKIPWLEDTKSRMSTIVSFAGAWTDVHIDANGCATESVVLNPEGWKLWFNGFSKSEDHQLSLRHSIQHSYSKKSLPDWRVEVVLCHQADMLYVIFDGGQTSLFYPIIF